MAYIKEIYSFDISTPANTPLQYGTSIKDDYMTSGPRRIRVTGSPGAIFSLKSTRVTNTNTTTPTTDCYTYILTDTPIPPSGSYIFNYNIPPSTSINRYDIQLMPGHATVLGELVPKTVPTYSINQYPNPVITLTSASSTLASVTESGSDVTFTGRIEYRPDPTDGYNKMTYTRTISHGSKPLYISKSPNIYTDYTNSLDIKKVTRKVNNTNNIEINPYIKSGETTVSFDGGRYAEIAAKSTPLTKQEDIKVGMHFSGEITHTKTFISFVINEICDECIDSSNILKLTDTSNIEVGMLVSALGVTANVVSIENDTDILISKIPHPEVLKNGMTLIFNKTIAGRVETLCDGNNITVDSPKIIPANTVLTFYNDRSKISGTISTSGGGSKEVTITGEIFIDRFGKESVTYTQQVDDFITFTPNAWDQRVVTTKDTVASINLVAADTDINIASKTITIVSNPFSGVLGAVESDAQSKTYTPNTGFLGDDSFTFKVNDGTTDSDIRTINITVKK